MATVFSSDSIPNRFDYRQAQDRLYRYWMESGCFNADVDQSRPPFCIVIPPPNVTGALHLGHALNNTLQDVLIRMKRMQGFNALWMPGTDHAGIATQAVVEKRLLEEERKSRHDLGREKLVERIWDWKKQYETRILGQLQRMGCSCDWRRTRFTLDETCARAVRQTFFDLFSKGLIYRGKRLVNWDTFLQTAVSDDEVFHETVQGHFWHLRYPVIDPKPGEPAFVSVATTRPETMLGDTAVAVHPDPAGALAQAEADLAAKLAEAPAKDRSALQQQLDEVRQRTQSMRAALEQLRDMALDGRKVLLPLMDRPIPLVADRWAKPELGSGCVKITPAHDPNDYEVGLRQSLPMINILNSDGTLNENAGAYRGLNVQEARSRVVADLQERELLDKVEDREIDLAHSDRSKTPIEPFLADQWFVRMADLAQSAMDAVNQGRVRILPSRYTKGYLDWLSEKRDWPIGRQLWWGHRIPVWTLRLRPADESERAPDTAAVTKELAALCTSLGHADFDKSVVADPAPPDGCVRICTRTDEFDRVLEHLREMVQKRGAGHKVPGAYVKIVRAVAAVEREEEVLDTWFSSALWPHSTLGWPEKTPELAYFYPTNVLITSRDIITLWVARMVLTGLNNLGEVPFRDVFIHPKILDSYGETMSKSKGNGVDPLDVIDKFGPDALRFGLAYLTTETQDVRMPVQFECPHCEQLIEQTKENRERPRVSCPKCHEPFATQWARTDADRALPRGPVVSERFEQARNFGNKLWNAARFALLNLEGFEPGLVQLDQLALEDRWLLSRLATVTKAVTESLEAYHYADASRTLYDFAWDEFCSFYLEVAKSRLQDPAQRGDAQRVLAHALDVLLRLLHPIMPFITEEIWQLLNRVAPKRGLSGLSLPDSIMRADWPKADASHVDEQSERRFRLFQAVVGAVREIRSRQNIAPRKQLDFYLRADDDFCRLLQPMQTYFLSLANARMAGCGLNVQVAGATASVNAAGMEVLVDLTGLIDVSAEISRNEQQEKKLQGLIQAKEKKLANASFVEKAPADVVEKERESLLQLQQQLAAVRAALAELRQQE
jgi:valyl-tRNA synthetase